MLYREVPKNGDRLSDLADQADNESQEKVNQS